MKDDNKTKEQLIKEAEQKLRESEERFRALTENTSDWIWEVDQSFVFTYTSPKVKDLLGYEPNEIIGKTPFDLMPEHESKRISKIAHSIKASRKPFTSLENANLHKDGHKVIIETSGIPIFDKNGNFSGYRGIDRDITERKKIEHELRHSEEKFRSLAEQSPNMIFINNKGRIVYVNQKCAEIMGYTKKEFYKESFDFRSLIAPEYLDLVSSAFQKHMRGEEVPPYEYTVLTKDSKRLDVIISTNLIDYENEKAILGIITDITERKKIEKNLKEKERELRIQSKNLEEANIALKVLLKKMDEDKIELEEKVLLNVKEMIVPYLAKLKMSRLDESQMTYLSILESSLTQITSPFSLRMSSKYFNFTPKELQIVNLLKQGKTNKEIGELLNSSPRTIACHRENIRKKLGLKNKKANLKSYLLSVK